MLSIINGLKKSPGMQKLIALLGLIVTTASYLAYSLYSQRYISTDDAYLNANVVQIAPHIDGEIIRLYVVNNQAVQQRQALLEIDPAPYQIAVERAEAKLNIDTALLQDAQLTAKRTLLLVKEKILPPQTGDDTVAKLKIASATVAYDQANLAEAELNLRYTHIMAPVSGWITNMSLRAGNIVTANQPLFALIDNAEFWVDANYKETQLDRIKPGQSATIVVDMYPQHIFKGVVESISGGSGTAFSLLPPQNATGNWVKVTQRVPVRVRVENNDAHYPLKIGATATVTIDAH